MAIARRAAARLQGLTAWSGQAELLAMPSMPPFNVSNTEPYLHRNLLDKTSDIPWGPAWMRGLAKMPTCVYLANCGAHLISKSCFPA